MDKNGKLGLCVIGCGSFARTFSAAIQGELSEINLSFASRDAAKAAAFASEFHGVASFGAYEEAVSDPRVDAVYICTPHHLHLDHARLAAGAGKHVLLEKPLARTAAEARDIVDVAGGSGITLMVAENYRFMPPVVAAKGLIDSGAIGGLRLIQLQEDFPFRPVDWRNDAAHNGGGVLIDGGIHKASLLAWFAGDPAEVYAAQVPSAQPGLAAEDGVLAMFRYSSGLVGVINHSWSAGPHAARPWVTVSGSKASLAFELGGDWIDTIDSAGAPPAEPRQRPWRPRRNGARVPPVPPRGTPPGHDRQRGSARRGPGPGLLRVNDHPSPRPIPLKPPGSCLLLPRKSESAASVDAALALMPDPSVWCARRWLPPPRFPLSAW